VDSNKHEEYLTTSQVATKLGGIVSSHTIARWAREGLIPHIRTIGGRYRVRASDLPLIQQRMGQIDPVEQQEESSNG